jgi:UDP-N-acetylmuramate--alanine ligase
MKKLHFTGIGGAGMAPLAELSAAKGFPVSGSDEHDSPKCRHLASLGINVVIGHNAENLPPDAGMLIYSSAVPESNCERMRATQLNIPQLRRGNYLALFSSSYRRCVSVTDFCVTAATIHRGRRRQLLPSVQGSSKMPG